MTATAVDRQAPPSTGTRGRAGAGAVGFRLAAAVAVVLAWWLIAVAFNGVVPTPVATLHRLWDIVLHEQFASSVGVTLARVGAGMVVTVVVAVGVGIVMGRSRVAEGLLDTFILIGRTIPSLVWALVAVMVVGLNDVAPVLAVFLTATPLVALQIWEAAKAEGPELFEMARVFGVSRPSMLRHILLPALTPSIVAGTKLGLTLAWQVVVLAELFGMSSGVGYQIHDNFSNFDIAGVLSWTISFSVIMAAIEYGVIGSIQARVLRWRPGGEGTRA